MHNIVITVYISMSYFLYLSVSLFLTKNIIITDITIPNIYGKNNVPKIQINKRMFSKNTFPILKRNNILIIIITIINYFLFSINPLQLTIDFPYFFLSFFYTYLPLKIYSHNISAYINLALLLWFVPL